MAHGQAAAKMRAESNTWWAEEHLHSSNNPNTPEDGKQNKERALHPASCKQSNGSAFDHKTPL
jgi:hypothetical protein